jgi:hypothetical protein
MVNSMLELLNDTLVFSFPEIHPDARMTVVLHRTFRIPDDGKSYPLPPSVGRFPARHVDDFKDKVPAKWLGRGGVMVPLYQSEALWLEFQPQYSNLHMHHYPFAVKVATGKVSAVTGKKWSKKLKEGDYMVAPEQKWLDGYVVEDGTIRQFIAAPLGMGVTAEEQITGKAEFGGLQIEVVPMDPAEFAKRFPKRPPPPPSRGFLRGAGPMGRMKLCAATATKKSAGPLPGTYSEVKTSGGVNYSSSDIKVLSYEEAVAKRPEMYSPQFSTETFSCDMSRGVEFNGSDSIVEAQALNLDMGLAAGGKMVQQVFKDPYGLGVWSKTAKSRCFVHMCNSLGWQHLTGALPPHPPMTAAHYNGSHYPWFAFYEDGAASHAGTDKLKGLKSVAQIQKETQVPILPENQSVQPAKTVVLKSSKSAVRDGVWK